MLDRCSVCGQDEQYPANIDQITLLPIMICKSFLTIRSQKKEKETWQREFSKQKLNYETKSTTSLLYHVSALTVRPGRCFTELRSESSFGKDKLEDVFFSSTVFRKPVKIHVCQYNKHTSTNYCNYTQPVFVQNTVKLFRQ